VLRDNKEHEWQSPEHPAVRKTMFGGNLLDQALTTKLATSNSLFPVREIAAFQRSAVGPLFVARHGAGITRPEG
jgi:hypothetical protein